MTPTVLGCVKYLNTLPLIEGLERAANVRLVTAAPAALAGMLERGEADLALASLVDVARARGTLTLVPAGMIGCDGPTLTVRLFARVPMNAVRALAADTDSHTSVVLARVILKQVYGAAPEVRDYSAAEGGADAVLLIGDKVITGAPSAAEYPHQLDLGEAWKAWTGLPFVYAMWMCRAAEARSARVVSAARVLDRQRRRNAARLEWIVQKHAAERGWPADLARRYVEEFLRYEVTDEALAGARRFLWEAAEIGLLPAYEIPAETGAQAFAGAAIDADANP
ncbi:menaquinone biosynthesis protein [soil metagenome]